MSKHTPGPWRVIRYANDAGGIDTEDSREILYSRRLGSADARLIAAAPDLLAACKDASGGTYTDIADAGDLTESDEKCWAALDAAIAKAEA